MMKGFSVGTIYTVWLLYWKFYLDLTHGPALVFTPSSPILKTSNGKTNITFSLLVPKVQYRTHKKSNTRNSSRAAVQVNKFFLTGDDRTARRREGDCWCSTHFFSFCRFELLAYHEFSSSHWASFNTQGWRLSSSRAVAASPERVAKCNRFEENLFLKKRKNALVEWMRFYSETPVTSSLLKLPWDKISALVKENEKLRQL